MVAALSRRVAEPGARALPLALHPPPLALKTSTVLLAAPVAATQLAGCTGELQTFSSWKAGQQAVLELLFLKQGVILNKGAFLTHLYCGMDEPEMKTIDVIICRLRKKLAVAGVPTLIDTVWGCGYILRDPSLDQPDAAQEMTQPAVLEDMGAGWGARQTVAA